MVKEVYTNNDMVCHAWAHQLTPTGRNSNDSLHFRGPTIYSYGSHFPLGTLVLLPDSVVPTIPVVLMTSATYGLTTSKHQNHVRRAVSHLAVHYCHKAPYSRWGSINKMDVGVLEDLDWREWFDSEKTHCLNAIESAKNKLPKAQKPSRYLSEIKHQLSQYKTNYDVFLTQIKDPEHRQRVTEYFEEVMQAANLENLPNIEKIRDKAAKEVEREQERQAERERQAEIYVKKQLESFDEDLAKWKSCETQYLNNYAKSETFLRLEDSRVAYHQPDSYEGEPSYAVKTSKGVRIPLEEAKLAIIAFKRGKLLGQKIQQFTVTQVCTERQVIVAGCHTVPFGEIEYIDTLIKERGL